MKYKLTLIALLIIAYGSVKAQNEPIYKSYKGLVMAGYQGWFRAAGDESGNSWGHFGRNGKFDHQFVTIFLTRIL